MYIVFAYWTLIFHSVPGSVAFVSYSNMSDIFKPAFLKTIINTNKMLMSPVVSVLLPQTTKTTQLTKSINLTFMHTSVSYLHFYWAHFNDNFNNPFYVSPFFTF